MSTKLKALGLHRPDLMNPFRTAERRITRNARTPGPSTIVGRMSWWYMQELLKAGRSIVVTNQEMSNERMDEMINSALKRYGYDVARSGRTRLFAETSPTALEMRVLKESEALSSKENLRIAAWSAPHEHYAPTHEKGVPCRTPCAFCAALGPPTPKKPVSTPQGWRWKT
jgi:hypothetical protein